MRRNSSPSRGTNRPSSGGGAGTGEPDRNFTLRPSGLTSLLLAYGQDGALTELRANGRSLVAPLRASTQTDHRAHEQHQFVELPTPVNTHILTLTPALMKRLEDGKHIYDTADAALRLAHAENPHGLRIIICKVGDGVAYDQTKDPLLLAGLAGSNYAHVIVPPPAKGDGHMSAVRLNTMREYVATLPPSVRKEVALALDTRHRRLPAALAYLVDAGEPLVFLEWHGEYRRQLPLLRLIHQMLRGNVGDKRTTIMAHNMKRRFTGEPASVPLLMALHGVQAVAYRIGSIKAALYLQNQNAQNGTVPVFQEYRLRRGGWDKDGTDADCGCAAHEDALTVPGDYTTELPLFQRHRVHELYAMAVDRHRFIRAVIDGSAATFVNERDLLAHTYFA